MITFKSLESYSHGTLFNLLTQAYAPLFAKYVLKAESEMIGEWERFDMEAFTKPRGMGACVFVTEQDGEIVGFGSYDPRKRPTGKIGHHVVLPKYQRNGIGRKQLDEMMLRLMKERVSRVTVSTGDHPFFMPAQKLYTSYGFIEVARRSEMGKEFPTIYYEKPLV